MQIANPIYDTVFKYMMSDSKVAKAFLSAIIGEKIVKLDFSSKEYILKVDADKSKLDKTLEQLTVCHFDFKAQIETDDGYKTVLIELQKARLATDIMRFRRYLGAMYQDSENSYDKDKTKARQIYCIYFLNYEIGLSDGPIIKVDYTAWDYTTGVKIEGESEFVDGLNHLSWIVQIRKLKEKRRNELENLLSIFDQTNTNGNKHILEFDASQYPEKYSFIIRKLQEAYESKEVREQMQIEDDFFNELLMKEVLIAKQSEEIAKQSEKIAKQSEELVKKDEELAKQAARIAELERKLGLTQNLTE